MDNVGEHVVGGSSRRRAAAAASSCCGGGLLEGDGRRTHTASRRRPTRLIDCRLGGATTATAETRE